jgi:hypothetical protein
MVILAGRYGSIGPDGLSYTEMEYRYALDSGKPIIGFIHRTPLELAASRCEATDDGKAKLTAFRDLVQKKMCRFWDSPVDLGSQVSRSLVKLIKSNPGIGWVRGNLVPDESATDEILGLRRRIEELQQELLAASTRGPEGTKDLAQGEDTFEVSFAFVASPDEWAHNGSGYKARHRVKWNKIFFTVSPLMINECNDEALFNSLSKLVGDLARPKLQEVKELGDLQLLNFRIDSDDFQTIKIQLRALGLITKSTKSRSVKDTSTYWTLTPYGDTVMTRLRAIQRESAEKEVLDI